MTSKDEMPQDNIDYKLVSEKVWEAMQMCRAEIARLEKENATLRALLSPPVPDDVAEAIEKFNDPDYFANGKSETVKVLIRAASTPSAEVEYWKDKCYTAESDAEIHAQCHDKVFDEKKALEAEVQALREALTFERDKIFYLMMRGAAGEYDIGLAKERMTKALKTHTGGE